MKTIKFNMNIIIITVLVKKEIVSLFVKLTSEYFLFFIIILLNFEYIDFKFCFKQIILYLRCTIIYIYIVVISAIRRSR